MLENFSNEQALLAIEHLSQLCFDVHKAIFIRQGSTSFLADLIRAYVDKYDGERFVRTYHEEGREGLRHFKFSQQPTAVLYVIWYEALIRASADQQYIKFLPINMSNKVWQAMIMDRADLSKVTLSELAIFSTKLQELAQDGELLNDILLSNLDIEQAYDVAKQTVGQYRPRAIVVTDKDRFFASLDLRKAKKTDADKQSMDGAPLPSQPEKSGEPGESHSISPAVVKKDR